MNGAQILDKHGQLKEEPKLFEASDQIKKTERSQDKAIKNPDIWDECNFSNNVSLRSCVSAVPQAVSQ